MLEIPNIKFIVERIKEIPNVTVAHITTGKFNVFCKIRAKAEPQMQKILYLSLMKLKVYTEQNQ